VFAKIIFFGINCYICVLRLFQSIVPAFVFLGCPLHVFELHFGFLDAIPNKARGAWNAVARLEFPGAVCAHPTRLAYVNSKTGDTMLACMATLAFRKRTTFIVGAFVRPHHIEEYPSAFPPPTPPATGFAGKTCAALALVRLTLLTL